MLALASLVRRSRAFAARPMLRSVSKAFRCSARSPEHPAARPLGVCKMTFLTAAA